ncbi:30S ribosomal protein S20 [bacterium]|nr:30S ribosomal protein S20 [bacterium]
MPNLRTSIKDLRQTKKRTIFNDRLRNRVKKATKRFNTLVEEKKLDEATKALPQVNKVLDKAAKKHIIKKGNASRNKSRLAAKLNNLAQENVKPSKKST